MSPSTAGAGACRSGCRPCVVVVAYFIRRQLHETPQFTEAKKAGTIARMPLIPLLRNHWRDVVRVILCAFIAAVSTVFGQPGPRLRQSGSVLQADLTPVARRGRRTSLR